jgi:protein required for attachment to host cells
MTLKLKIPHDGRVLVGDGRKALMLCNRGDEFHPNLELERLVEAPANPATRLQGTDRPGRVAMGGRRSAVEQSDWHDLAEHRFAAELASILQDFCTRQKVEAVVIVAPPRTLADLRNALPTAVSRHIIAEINKDLTKCSVDEIERHLTGG